LIYIKVWSQININDAPPNSLKDPNVGPRAKQWKKERIEARFVICSISRVGAHVGASRWD